jgi:hypothetical protein
MDFYKLIPSTLNLSQDDKLFCIHTCPKSHKIMDFEDVEVTIIQYQRVKMIYEIIICFLIINQEQHLMNL